MASIVCELYDQKLIEARAIPQLDTFKAGVQFARSEGIVPAPEPTHAIAAVIQEALKCKESGEQKVILFNLCGHDHFDMSAYDAYLSGKLEDYEYPQEEVEKAMAALPVV